MAAINSANVKLQKINKGKCEIFSDQMIKVVNDIEDKIPKKKYSRENYDITEEEYNERAIQTMDEASWKFSFVIQDNDNDENIVKRINKDKNE